MGTSLLDSKNSFLLIYKNFESRLFQIQCRLMILALASEVQFRQPYSPQPQVYYATIYVERYENHLFFFIKISDVNQSIHVIDASIVS